MATGTARRITNDARRYHPPLSSGCALRRAARWNRAGASEFTRGPSLASTTGSTVSATTPESTATPSPPMPIDRIVCCGKTSRLTKASATVADENATVRPALFSVRARTSSGEPPAASSSRYLLTTNSE